MVCGHWSALGLTITQGVHGIDTGAVWGGKLTALQLDSEDLRIVQVPGRDVPAMPPAPRHPRPNPDKGRSPRNKGRNGNGRQGGGKPDGAAASAAGKANG